MFSTRHFVLATALLVVSLIFILLQCIPKGGVPVESPRILVEGKDSYEVFRAPASAGSTPRELFKIRVREYLSALPSAAKEEPEAFVEEVADTTLVVSSVPKAGAVFACASAYASYVYDIPQSPRVAVSPLCLPTGVPIGIFNSGAFLYSGVLEAEHETDACGRAAGPDGVAHHHTESSCVSASASGSIGYAFDGFSIYPSSEGGVEVTNEDLDVCHGHTHSILVNGAEMNQYHYHMTEEYPYSMGCFKGVPTASL